ncbi:MAG: ABC transporter ATP-binding protein [Deltaproteobacteria bacterium]|nr:MAG: ABC transporter ATP-binding protein [Deltaproteobacteria bacterium]RLC26005.1 MAG: ABC transporter ATP-binding protein [Deltaproteobacteria bacterium]
MTLPFIQFIDVTKSFGSNHVLKGLNLSIFKGEIMAVIGKSGTGKSVLLKHIIGLVEQDSGQILIKGESRHQLSVAASRSFHKELSYMFQDNALFDFMNIYDNVALPLVENSKFSKTHIKEKVITRIKQLGLTGTLEKFPAQLSGGMRKRVALARALVTDPKVVLFDEPTTGLDPVRKKKVHSMIQEYQEQFGFTAVIVTHDIPEIFNIAQRIAMLDDGIIKFEGSKKDILDSHSKTLNAFIRGEDV